MRAETKQNKKKDKTYFLQSEQSFLNSFCFSVFPAPVVPPDTWTVHKDREENSSNMKMSNAAKKITRRPSEVLWHKHDQNIRAPQTQFWVTLIRLRMNFSESLRREGPDLYEKSLAQTQVKYSLNTFQLMFPYINDTPMALKSIRFTGCLFQNSDSHWSTPTCLKTWTHTNITLTGSNSK